MKRDIYHLIKTYKPNLMEKSIEFYVRNLNKLNERVFLSKGTVIKNIKIKKNFKLVKKWLEENIESVSTKKNIVSSILVILGALKHEKVLVVYQEYHSELAKIREEGYLDNVMTKKEENNWVSSEEINEIIKGFQDSINSEKLNDYSYFDIFQKYLVLKLYTLLPPLRNDYASMKVISEEDSEELLDLLKCSDESKSTNYIVIPLKQIFLCTYKTKKFYGIKKIDIPDELLDLIIEWENVKKNYTDIVSENLLINPRSKTDMGTNSLTKYLNRIFYPKKVSTTLLRKAYLSEKYPVLISYREQLKDAYVMGHSPTMQKMVYSKKLK